MTSTAAQPDSAAPEISGLTFSVPLPARLRWRADLRGREHKVDRLVVTLQADGKLSVRGYGRPSAGGPASTTAFAVVDHPELTSFVGSAAERAAALLSGHRGLR